MTLRIIGRILFLLGEDGCQDWPVPVTGGGKLVQKVTFPTDSIRDPGTYFPLFPEKTAVHRCQERRCNLKLQERQVTFAPFIES